MTSATVMVGMAEIHVLKGAGTFTCLGLGSCVGLCALDPVAGVAGCAHIMLPKSFDGKPVDRPGKFANTGVPELIDMLERMGAGRDRLVFAMAGGAQVFKFGSETAGAMLDIGARNVAAVEQELARMDMDAVGKDVGGTHGRTLQFIVESGQIMIRTAVQGEKPLVNLRK